MLKRTTRSELSKHSLLYVMKQDGNPSQYWNRLKETCLKAIRDLALVASKSSEEEVREIFNEDTIKDLIYNIFIRYFGDNISDTREPDVKLASFVANMGINVCIREYKKWNTDMPETSKPTIDYLYQAQAICREIAYKYAVNLIENDHLAKKSQPRWMWEEITSKQRDRFDKYILNHGGFKFVENEFLLNRVLLKQSNRVKKEYDIYQSYEELEDDYDGSGEDGSDESVIFLGHVTVLIDPVKNTGKISYYDNELKEIKNEDLVLKKYGAQTALWVK